MRQNQEDQGLRCWLLVGLLLASATAAQEPTTGNPGPDSSDGGTLVTLTTDSSESLEPCRERYLALTLTKQYPRVDFLIATLPDPLDSRFARDFDILLGSLHRALSRLGFVRDRHCLPWTEEGDRPQGKASDGAQGKDRAGLHLRAYREIPGVLFFDDPANERAIVVLVVGETPFWGLQHGAFTTALNWVDAHVPPGGVEEAGSLHLDILGPSFSGSVRSLATALADWLAAKPEAGTAVEIRIRSGTTTNHENRKILECELACDLGHRAEIGCAADVPSHCKENYDLAVSFRSAATDGLWLQRCLLEAFLPSTLQIGRAVQHDGEARQPVALLVESSIYGREFEQAHQRYYTFPFPVHISQLRAAYDEEKRANDPATKRSEPLEVAPEPLGLVLGEDRPTRDRLPSFSPFRTSRTQDLVLANILTTIARNRIQAVAIVATNVMDKLFLAQILNRYAPDVRLLTYEGDLLLAHPDYRRATQGMLVASSYPLVDPGPFHERASQAKGAKGTADAAASFGTHLQFPSDGAQGIYEAVRWLVDGDPSEPLAKRVWISAVGRSTLYPLERYRIPSDADRGFACADSWRGIVKDEDAVAARRPLPRGWSLLFSLSSLLIGFALIEIGISFFRHGAVGGGLVSWSLLWPRPFKSSYVASRAERSRHAFVAVLPLAVFLPYFMLSLPYLKKTPSFFYMLWSYAGLFLLGAAIVFTLLGMLIRTVADIFLDNPVGTQVVSLRTLRVLLPFGAILALHFLAAVFVLWVFKRASPDLVLLLDRSIAFSSGLSPILPLFLFFAVPLLWILLSLWRHRTLDAIPEVEGGRDERTKTLKGCIADLRRALDPASTFALHRYILPAFLLIAAPVLYLCRYYDGRFGPLLHGLENVYFDRATSLMLLFGLLLTVGSGVWLWRGWSALRCVLDQIATFRFRGEVDKDKEQVLWLEGVQQAGVPGGLSHELVVAERRDAYDDLQGQARKGSAEQDDEDENEPDPATPRALRRALVALPETATDASPAQLGCAWLAICHWLDLQPGPVRSQRRGPDEAETVRRQARASALIEQVRTFFAWQTAVFTREVLSQLLKLMGFMTAGLILLLVTVSVYPFEPRRVLLFQLGGLISLGILTSTVVVLQIERNKILSHLAGTNPERITWHRTLISRMGLYAGLPIFSLLASQFPEVRQVLFDWIEPVFKVLL